MTFLPLPPKRSAPISSPPSVAASGAPKRTRTRPPFPLAAPLPDRAIIKLNPICYVLSEFPEKTALERAGPCPALSGGAEKHLGRRTGRTRVRGRRRQRRTATTTHEARYLGSGGFSSGRVTWLNYWENEGFLSGENSKRWKSFCGGTPAPPGGVA